jgi:hypothetical protein
MNKQAQTTIDTHTTYTHTTAMFQRLGVRAARVAHGTRAFATQTLRRHPVTAFGGVAFAALLVGGLTTSSIQSARARESDHPSVPGVGGGATVTNSTISTTKNLSQLEIEAGSAASCSNGTGNPFDRESMAPTPQPADALPMIDLEKFRNPPAGRCWVSL